MEETLKGPYEGFFHCAPMMMVKKFRREGFLWRAPKSKEFTHAIMALDQSRHGGNPHAAAFAA